MGRIGHAFCLAVVLLVTTAARAVPASSPEYEVKAAFLHKFGNFVDVPVAGRAPFVLTVLGDDPFGDALDDMARGRTVDGRPVQIRRTRNVQEAARSGIVFISASEKGRLQEILAALQNTRTLTVGDVEGFAAAGGMIGFVVEQNRVRFEINPGAAEQAGIHINAKLLNLARIVSTGR